MRKIELNGIYKHFKGHVYKVIAIGYDPEKYNDKDPSKSRVVVYENVETKEVWVRDYDMFNSLVDKEKYPNLKQEYRFEKIEKEGII